MFLTAGSFSIGIAGIAVNAVSGALLLGNPMIILGFMAFSLSATWLIWNSRP